MASLTPLHALSELLRGSRALPVVSPGRQAPSTIYDLRYRLLINACAVELHTKEISGVRRIGAARLKLVQFVAMRPWLFPVVQEWSSSQGEAQLSLLSSHLRRGFLGDTMHDALVDFLVAHGILTRSAAHLLPGPHGDTLTNLYATAVERSLFATERAILGRLIKVKITNDMLEGW